MALKFDGVMPHDEADAVLVGRVWVPGRLAGPSVVTVSDGRVRDLGTLAPTSSALLELDDPVAAVRGALAEGRLADLGDARSVLANSDPRARDETRPHLLAPCDLQAIRACGVTFVASMLERVIEEHAKGDPAQAEEIRGTLGREIGASLSSLKPGSPEAMRVKEVLVGRGLWSQYLEVGIGPDAEVFNKSQPMSAVGLGADVGILEASSWNNPEPELVLALNSKGRIVGAALGNDVNLRDWEGRSALLLGRAKDNNGSCAIGPFIRLLDGSFTLDDLRGTEITVEVRGEDGFLATGRYSLSEISRDPADLAAQAMGANHQYPDGAMLFLGTAFAPTQDRGAPGHGFTHHVGDIVTVSAAKLGSLVNRVDHCHRIAPWTFGAGALLRNLSERGLV
ncbi:MAG: fumarylacetoacetate hydrolase [Betaproteobacteria bacterium]|nr:fumarylacetoacetate hydrolase [Betaproteobacteria bacterium]